MRIDKYRFCPDDIWDSNLTWFSNKPRFTKCFENTALVFPSCLLIILGIPWIFWISYTPQRFLKKNPSISWLYLCKISLNIVAIIVTVMGIYVDVNERQTLTWSDVLKYTLSLFNLTFALLLNALERHYGITSSLVLFLFWPSVVVANFPAVLNNLQNYSKYNCLPFALEILMFVLYSLLAFTNLISDLSIIYWSWDVFIVRAN